MNAEYLTQRREDV